MTPSPATALSDKEKDPRNIAARCFDEVSVPIFGYSVSEGIFYFNHAFYSSFGKLDSLLPPSRPSLKSVVARPQKLFSEQLKEFKSRNFKILLVSEDENFVFIEVSSSPKEFATDSGFSLPLSQENPYAEIIGSLREVLFFADNEGVIRYISPAWEALSGFSIKDTIGKNYLSFVENKSKSQFHNLLSKEISDEQNFLREEIELKKKNGEALWIELSASLQRNPDGSLMGLYGVLYDINDRKIGELKLAESEERYRLISENINDLVILCNLQADVNYLSASARQFFYGNDDTKTSLNLVDRLYHADIAAFRTLLKSVIAGDTEQQGSYRLSNHNDEFVWLACSVSPYRTAKSDEVMILFSCRDISFQKRAEEEILDTLEKERELNRLKSDFINMASHEFRTPLTAMKSSIDLIDNYAESLGDTGVRMKKHTLRIKGQIGRLTTLISDILMLGRLESGSIHYRPERTDIVALINEVIREHYSQRSDGRTAELITEGSARPLYCDGAVMSHVIGNLLSNAFKYSEGKPNPQVLLRFFEEKVEIFVTDFGMGIPDEDQGLLFNSFFRGQNVLNIPGTGLGLIIIKQFVELHNGNITFESKIGVGTTFVVTLPYD